MYTELDDLQLNLTRNKHEMFFIIYKGDIYLKTFRDMLLIMFID